MCDDFFDDLDFGDLLGLGLSIGEEIGEEEAERFRIEKELEEGDDYKPVDDENII